jgi:hypothetical protein
MRSVLPPLALVIACLITVPSMAAEAAIEPPKPVKVLASLPITYGLADVLLKGTDVKLERAAPANLPGTRQVSYFTGRGAPALNTLAQDADAAIGLRSLWADDPLYPVARRSNIRIEAVKTAVTAGGAQLLVLKVDGADPLAELEGNVDQVIKALSP